MGADNLVYVSRNAVVHAAEHPHGDAIVSAPAVFASSTEKAAEPLSMLAQATVRTPEQNETSFVQPISSHFNSRGSWRSRHADRNKQR